MFANFVQPLGSAFDDVVERQKEALTQARGLPAVPQAMVADAAYGMQVGRDAVRSITDIFVGPAFGNDSSSWTRSPHDLFEKRGVLHLAVEFLEDAHATVRAAVHRIFPASAAYRCRDGESPHFLAEVKEVVEFGCFAIAAALVGAALGLQFTVRCGASLSQLVLGGFGGACGAACGLVHGLLQAADLVTPGDAPAAAAEP